MVKNLFCHVHSTRTKYWVDWSDNKAEGHLPCMMPTGMNLGNPPASNIAPKPGKSDSSAEPEGAPKTRQVW